MLYSQKVMENFKNTKNYGKKEDADGIGKVGNPKCGDVMWIYIKVKDGIIADAKYETFGCVAAIATSSMASDVILKPASLTSSDIIEILSFRYFGSASVLPFSITAAGLLCKTIFILARPAVADSFS